MIKSINKSYHEDRAATAVSAAGSKEGQGHCEDHNSQSQGETSNSSLPGVREDIIISALHLFHQLVNVRNTLAFEDLEIKIRFCQVTLELSHQSSFWFDAIQEDSSYNLLVHFSSMCKIIEFFQSVYCQV